MVPVSRPWSEGLFLFYWLEIVDSFESFDTVSRRYVSFWFLPDCESFKNSFSGTSKAHVLLSWFWRGTFMGADSFLEKVDSILKVGAWFEFVPFNCPFFLRFSNEKGWHRSIPWRMYSLWLYSIERWLFFLLIIDGGEECFFFLGAFLPNVFLPQLAMLVGFAWLLIEADVGDFLCSIIDHFIYYQGNISFIENI